MLRTRTSSAAIQIASEATHGILCIVLFPGGYYIQRKGAVIGVTFLPSLAYLFVAWWEECHIFTD